MANVRHKKRSSLTRAALAWQKIDFHRRGIVRDHIDHSSIEGQEFRGKALSQVFGQSNVVGVSGMKAAIPLSYLFVAKDETNVALRRWANPLHIITKGFDSLFVLRFRQQTILKFFAENEQHFGKDR